MVIIRTVTGDIPPESLGLTLGHDHVFARPPSDITDGDLRINDEAASVAEMRMFRAAGGSAMVEMTTVDYGRDLGTLQRISEATGIHFIAATGFNKGKFADRLTEERSVEEIAAWMTAEVNEGARQFSTNQPVQETSSARCGLIKASSSLDHANSNELKVFEAAIQAHHATGAPISTHTEKGTWALEQIALFEKGGVPLNSVLIGHLDLKPELPYLLEVAATGANLGLDQFAKVKYLSDETRVELIAQLVAAGYGKQILIGGDLARRSYWKHYGDPCGFTFIPLKVVLMLKEAGLSEGEVEDILVENPKRFLVFSPQPSAFS
jgi:5-phospho-D-xylono-1,4-lactonase